MCGGILLASGEHKFYTSGYIPCQVRRSNYMPEDHKSIGREEIESLTYLPHDCRSKVINNCSWNVSSGKIRLLGPWNIVEESLESLMFFTPK